MFAFQLLRRPLADYVLVGGKVAVIGVVLLLGISPILRIHAATVTMVQFLYNLIV